jgi:hypothetical protein
MQMLYTKINVELIVVADEAEAVVEGLNAALLGDHPKAATCGHLKTGHSE